MKIRIIMFLLHLLYLERNKNRNEDLMFIKGYDKEFPRFTIYTENVNIRDYLIGKINALG